ncbi:MAG: AzlD domain-containing protein [Acetobacteraceae bacterium]|nr:AzlD domain-containing protein [Acetobacteraceae bacterium]
MRLSMLLLFLGMAVATYITRATFLIFGKRINFPPLFLRSLRYVPIAMLAAIIFPAVLAPRGHIDPSPTNPYLLAALATVLVVKLTRSSVAGMLVGMALILALRVWM